jgi:hypothetical protein
MYLQQDKKKKKSVSFELRMSSFVSSSADFLFLNECFDRQVFEQQKAVCIVIHIQRWELKF